MSVLSNKPHRFTTLCIERYFPPGTFQCILGQRDHVPKKPDPAAAYEIAFSLGIAPSRISFIGDTEIDIRTGLAAGMSSIGVEWGFRPVSELLDSGATLILNKPADLPPLFL